MNTEKTSAIIEIIVIKEPKREGIKLKKTNAKGMNLKYFDFNSIFCSKENSMNAKIKRTGVAKNQKSRC